MHLTFHLIIRVHIAEAVDVSLGIDEPIEDARLSIKALYGECCIGQSESDLLHLVNAWVVHYQHHASPLLGPLLGPLRAGTQVPLIETHVAQLYVSQKQLVLPVHGPREKALQYLGIFIECLFNGDALVVDHVHERGACDRVVVHHAAGHLAEFPNLVPECADFYSGVLSVLAIAQTLDEAQSIIGCA